MALPHPEGTGPFTGTFGQPFAAAPGRDSEAEDQLALIYGPRAGALAEELVTDLAAAYTRASEIDDDLRNDIINQARITFTRAVGLVASGESFEVMTPLIEDVARRRRDQQVSQELIFAGYRYLQHLLFERITEQVRDHPIRARLIDALALRQLEFGWVVSRGVAAAFDTGPEVMAASREESVQAVLESLVGQRAGSASLTEHAALYGVLMPLDHIAVTPAMSPDRSVPLTDWPAVRPIARANPWSVTGMLGNRVVVIGRGRPWGLTGPHGGCSITEEMLNRPDLMAERVALAAQAADVAPRLAQSYVNADEVAPFVAVAALPAERQDAFLRSCFGDLHTSSRGLPILRAVSVSVRTAGRKEAARMLKVHPNTLDYRLARFRELTGLTLTDPIHRMRCDLGLFLLGLLGE